MDRGRLLEKDSNQALARGQEETWVCAAEHLGVCFPVLL